MDREEHDIEDMSRAEIKKYLENMPYSIGDRFMYQSYEFILVPERRDEVNMINLRTGRIWKDSIKVKNCYILTEEEFAPFKKAGFKLKVIV